MKLSTTLKLPTYNCELIFTITDQLKKETVRIYKKFNMKLDENDDTESEGILITADIDKYYLIIDNKYLTHNTIAHEVYHGVVRITEDRGIVDEEAQAWLAGHLSEVIYKFLEKKKFEVKNGN